MSKTQHELLVTVALVACITLTGCVSRRVSRPRGEGYGFVDKTYHSDLMHPFTRSGIYYWDKKGKKTLIWPYLSNDVKWTNDVAVFHGYLTASVKEQPAPGARRVEQLFAAQGPGPAANITDDVVRLWAIAAGKTNVLELLRSGLQRIDNIEKEGTRFKIKVVILYGGHGTVELTRDQVVDMIREAREKGRLMKDPGSGTPYFKRDWERDFREQK